MHSESENRKPKHRSVRERTMTTAVCLLVIAVLLVAFLILFVNIRSVTRQTSSFWNSKPGRVPTSSQSSFPATPVCARSSPPTSTCKRWPPGRSLPPTTPSFLNTLTHCAKI